MTTITAEYFFKSSLPSNTPASGTYVDKTTKPVTDEASSLQASAFPELAQIARECAKEGWDGYRAKPITQETCDRVSDFLSGLPSWIIAPDIVPESDGEIAIEWYVAPRLTFSISIGQNGPITFAGLFGQDEEIYGVAPFIGQIPENILPHISVILRGTSLYRAA